MSLLEEDNPAVPVPAPVLQTNGTSTPPPIITFQLRRELRGVPTDLVIQTFDDRILVIVTQNGKVGCLIQASLPAVVPLPLPPQANGPATADVATNLDPLDLAYAAGGVAAPLPAASSLPPLLPALPLPPPSPHTTLAPLLGTPPDAAATLYEVYAAQLATLVWWSLSEAGQPRRPVVLGLALRRGASDGAAAAVRTGGDGQGEEDGAGAGAGVFGAEERDRFVGVCEMVGEWRYGAQ